MSAERKPLIGMTISRLDDRPAYFMRENYADSVLQAGAVPVLLPYRLTDQDIAQIAAQMDGFLFTGGNDVVTARFGEQTLAGCGESDEERDEMEIRLCRAAVQAGKPVFGICRGIQLMNVALGGTLWQDLPSQFRARADAPKLAHQQPSKGKIVSHLVQVKEGSLLEKILKKDGETRNRIWVNSFHHQAVRTLAQGCEAVAYSQDGVIEAIEMPSYRNFFLGVQWHPEYMAVESAPEDWNRAAKSLFKGFAEACANGI